jgi:large subunit ribosomal protein L23
MRSCRPLFDILKYPIVTEKTQRIAEDGYYSFAVDKHATKHLIKLSIQQIFNVRVISVKTGLPHVKKRRQIQKIGGKARGIELIGKKSCYKKAMVKLAPGDSLDIYSS